MTLHSRRDGAGAIGLQILKQGDCLGSSEQAQHHHRALERRKREGVEAVSLPTLKMEAEVINPGMKAPPDAEKDRTDSSYCVQEEHSPANTLSLGLLWSEIRTLVVTCPHRAWTRLWGRETGQRVSEGFW